MPFFLGCGPGLGQPDQTLRVAAAGGGLHLAPVGDGVACDEAGLLLRLAACAHRAFVDAVEGHVLHAAGLALRGRAHLFLAPSRAGKSTLAFAGWRAGWEVVGDDRVALDAAGATMEALPMPVKLRRDGCDRFPPGLADMPPRALVTGRLHGEERAALARGLPGMAPLGRRYGLDAVHLLERSAEPGWSLEPAGERELVLAVLGAELEGAGRPLAALRPLLALRAGGRAFRLRVGPDAAGEALAGLAARAAGPG